MKHSHVYILVHQDGTRLKIGKADNVVGRATVIGLEYFQLPLSFAVLVDSASEANRVERGLHRMFHGFRLLPAEVEGQVPRQGATEWFRIECFPRVSSFIDANSDLMGVRARVTGVELVMALRLAAEEVSKQAPQPIVKTREAVSVIAPADRVNTSATSRLRQLPAAFSLTEVAMVCGCEKKQASQYVWRWRDAGLVVPLGGNSGIFLNKVIDPSAETNGGLWERALMKAMPSAIIGGHEVLADSGLTTQVTHLRYVLISNTDSFCTVNGAEVHRRPVPWLNRLVREGAVVNDEPGVLAPRLRPGAALADLALYAARKPDPDDIDMDEIGPDDVALFKRLSKAESIEDVAPKRRAKPR